MNGITPRRSRSDRSFWKEFLFDCRARIARAGLSARGIRFFTTRRRANLTCRSCISPKNKRAFAFTTARSQKLPSSGSITATRSITQECFVLWEAQFGDFANGAQTIIDQFIVSAESKWQRPSGIVLLLPHGYEGQGPEHSSARLERFLQACAEDNIQVCNLTTAAQYFHVLRRQMKRDFIKPLIIMTPKSLLRAEVCLLAGGRIHQRPVRGNSRRRPKSGLPTKMKRIILCSGKVYYDLLITGPERRSTNAAIIRVEQLYPLAEKKLREMLKPFPKNAKFVWCQEEPQNMGAWTFIEPRLRTFSAREIAYAGREASASPAVGALADTNASRLRLSPTRFQFESTLAYVPLPWHHDDRLSIDETLVARDAPFTHGHRSENSGSRRIDHQRRRFRLAQEIGRVRERRRSPLHPRDRQGFYRDHCRKSRRAGNESAGGPGSEDWRGRRHDRRFEEGAGEKGRATEKEANRGKQTEAEPERRPQKKRNL